MQLLLQVWVAALPCAQQTQSRIESAPLLMCWRMSRQRQRAGKTDIIQHQAETLIRRRMRVLPLLRRCQCRAAEPRLQPAYLRLTAAGEHMPSAPLALRGPEA